jgi:uncharacterized protein with HEPN domain
VPAKRLPISRRIGKFRFIAQRAIEIISEATRRLPDELKATRPEIEWRSIAAIGNVLRHEYHAIADRVVWDVIQADLPPLKAAVEAIAAAMKE